MAWYSLDPREALRDLDDMSKEQLRQVAYAARNPEARRAAVRRIGDQGLIRAFAKEDPSPMVRRGLVRILEDREALQYIAENDEDRSVRQTAEDRLEQLQLL